MARTNNLTNFLTDVAAAIKNKKGVNTNIPAANFDIEINNFTILHGQEKTVTPLITNQSITPDANYNAMTVVNIVGVDNTIDSNIQPENIKQGVTILNITGTLQEGINTSDATATVSDILENKTAYANGVKLVGTMTDESDNSVVLTPSFISDSSYNSIILQSYLNRENRASVDNSTRFESFISYANVAELEHITPNILKKDISLFGVTGIVEELVGETINVIPTTNQQVITPSSGKNGITEVTVAAVSMTEQEIEQAEALAKTILS